MLKFLRQQQQQREKTNKRTHTRTGFINNNDMIKLAFESSIKSVNSEYWNIHLRTKIEEINQDAFDVTSKGNYIYFRKDK